MKPKVYVLGNPLVKEDSLPLRILPTLREKLPEIEFIETDTVEDVEGKNLKIIDTVLGTKDIQVITDINLLVAEKSCTVHDYDLAMMLKLLKKVGKIESVKIFGIPKGMNKDKAVNTLIILLKANISN